jgi:arylsulfatase A-like enzyme
VRQGRWKYIEAPEEGTRELYDLESDPHELQSLFATRPQEAKALSTVLARWLQTTPAAAAGAIPPDTVDRIRSLGYVP